jgi:EmrB/QacA subfamily drug resistance transporter
MSDRTAPMNDSPSPSGSPVAHPRLVLAGALLSMVLAALDQNIVNTALPRIVGDLGGLAHMSWLVTAFMLTATATTPLYGRLSDIHGRRPLFFCAIGLFLVGSLLCGLAQSMPQLIVLRAVQGLGAGGLLVLAQSAIGDVFSPRQRPKYQGLITGAFALASVAGPLIGGGITSVASWRWVFFVNLPVAGAALAFIAVGLEDRVKGTPRPIDYAGVGLLAATTAALLLWLAWGGMEFPWISLPSGLFVATVAVGFVLFVRRERVAPDPLVRLALLANVTYARGLFIGGMMTFAMMGSTVFLPLYFQLVLGMDPALAGVMLLPQVAGMMLTSVIGGRIVSRLGSGRVFLLLGVGLEALALFSLAGFSAAGAGAATFLISTFALGLGMGMGMPNLTVAVQNAVPYRELGAATGMMTFIRSLGGALGVAASGTIMAQHLASAIAVGRWRPGALDALSRLLAEQAAAVAEVYHGALMGCFGLSGAVMTAAWLVVWGLPDRRLRDRIDDRAE